MPCIGILLEHFLGFAPDAACAGLPPAAQPRRTTAPSGAAQEFTRRPIRQPESGQDCPRSDHHGSWCRKKLRCAPPTTLSVCGQLDRASTSAPLNIAEGNGKYTPPDRCHYFEIARGSALESAACLDVLVAKRACTADQVQKGKILLHEIVSLLIGLIKSLSPDRLGEEPLPYRTSEGQEQEQE